MKSKDENAVKLGSKGGIARAKKLTAERRKEIAQRAAQIRWANRNGEKKTHT